jgi:hypothetical protein
MSQVAPLHLRPSMADDLRQLRADRSASAAGDAVRAFFDAFRDTQPLDAESSAELQAERRHEWRLDDREGELAERRELGLE